MNNERTLSDVDARDANRDPLTGAPGSHPIGTGLGAVAGGLAAGAAAGTVVGPVGTIIGAAVGAVAGAFAGKGIAESIDPTAENAYWEDNYTDRPYVADGATYDDYGPAYRYGVDQFGENSDTRRSFDEVEPELSNRWDTARGTSSLEWDRAKHAVKDSWQRVSDTVERATPGDSDRDGK